MPKGCKIARRKRRHQQRCQVLFDAPEEDENGTSPTAHDNMETSRYTCEFIVQFCRENWDQWVRDAKSEIMQIQHDIVEYPSRRATNTLYNIEDLYMRLVKVIKSY